MTLAAENAARERGFDTAVLQSSPMGYRVYETLGYEEICTFGMFAPPGPPCVSNSTTRVASAAATRFRTLGYAKARTSSSRSAAEATRSNCPRSQTRRICAGAPAGEMAPEMTTAGTYIDVTVVRFTSIIVSRATYESVRYSSSRDERTL